MLDRSHQNSISTLQNISTDSSPLAKNSSTIFTPTLQTTWLDKISAFYSKNNLENNIYDSVTNLPRYVRVVSFPCKFLSTGPLTRPLTLSATCCKNKKLQDELLHLAALLEKELDCSVTPSKIILGLLRISNGSAKIKNTTPYRSGQIIGIDLSSAITALSLQICPNDHILDLCCAPGGKLLLASDILAGFGVPSINSYGSITGVDISSHRLSTCKNLIKKSNSLGKIRIRLFLEDGTKFNTMPPDDQWWDYTYHKNANKKRKRSDPSLTPHVTSKLNSVPLCKMPWYSSKLLRLPCLLTSKHKSLVLLKKTPLYDKVLVDAECTHDGSLVHLTKYISNSTNAKLDNDFLSDHRADSVANLQFNLLLNGWNSLKPDGILIYSTCSLSYKQNEEVIARFLSYMNSKNSNLIRKFYQATSYNTKKISENHIFSIEYPTIEPLDQIENFSKDLLAVSPLQLEHINFALLNVTNSDLASLRKCIRLDPRVSDTSGMFISKIRKNVF
ncbi:hypothetical protein BB561_001437 [Smittium simulii]|uniref:SAM-dependent MTase RsmB/NOP-type domain-containing protein n=1 Tax=Smittium simulii TaxID=133385 RepID=A0A2T9YUM4_9FUNG|nr:hypothetical protein BB561_001437 [Smittium simulii]